MNPSRSSPIIPKNAAPSQPTCAGCKTSCKKFILCSVCNETVYCNHECHLEHWQEHKKLCEAIRKQRTETPPPSIGLQAKLAEAEPSPGELLPVAIPANKFEDSYVPPLGYVLFSAACTASDTPFSVYLRTIKNADRTIKLLEKAREGDTEDPWDKNCKAINSSFIHMVLRVHGVNSPFFIENTTAKPNKGNLPDDYRYKCRRCGIVTLRLMSLITGVGINGKSQFLPLINDVLITPKSSDSTSKNSDCHFSAITAANEMYSKFSSALSAYKLCAATNKTVRVEEQEFCHMGLSEHHRANDTQHIDLINASLKKRGPLLDRLFSLLREIVECKDGNLKMFDVFYMSLNEILGIPRYEIISTVLNKNKDLVKKLVENMSIEEGARMKYGMYILLSLLALAIEKSTYEGIAQWGALDQYVSTLTSYLGKAREFIKANSGEFEKKRRDGDEDNFLPNGTSIEDIKTWMEVSTFKTLNADAQHTGKSSLQRKKEIYDAISTLVLISRWWCNVKKGGKYADLFCVIVIRNEEGKIIYFHDWSLEPPSGKQKRAVTLDDDIAGKRDLVEGTPCAEEKYTINIDRISGAKTLEAWAFLWNKHDAKTVHHELELKTADGVQLASRRRYKFSLDRPHPGRSLSNFSGGIKKYLAIGGRLVTLTHELPELGPRPVDAKTRISKPLAAGMTSKITARAVVAGQDDAISILLDNRAEGNDMAVICKNGPLSPRLKDITDAKHEPGTIGYFIQQFISSGDDEFKVGMACASPCCLARFESNTDGIINDKYLGFIMWGSPIDHQRADLGGLPRMLAPCSTKISSPYLRGSNSSGYFSVRAIILIGYCLYLISGDLQPPRNTKGVGRIPVGVICNTASKANRQFALMQLSDQPIYSNNTVKRMMMMGVTPLDIYPGENRSVLGMTAPPFTIG
jgi:hypothetical protein